MSVPAGYQNWRQLLFVHWTVGAAELRPLVPGCLDIDEFDGTAYVGLVPFVVEAARPLGAPREMSLRFLETNVRTYVHVHGRDHGVYFFSLDAASLLAVVGARLGLGLPYFWASGEQHVSHTCTEYALRRRVGGTQRCNVRYRVSDFLGPAALGTLEHFLIERYVLHVQRGPTLWSVRVKHPPYALYAAQLLNLEDDLVSAAGLLPRVDAPLVHFAPGVDVAINAPRITIAR
ncbi:MAG TPA: DUF2071 domain-containing protein [Chloroflexota bacterium]|nr:DUF2071 domain-containing protein [Chloroflexota bacterium]